MWKGDFVVYKYISKVQTSKQIFLLRLLILCFFAIPFCKFLWCLSPRCNSFKGSFRHLFVRLIAHASNAATRAPKSIPGFLYYANKLYIYIYNLIYYILYLYRNRYRDVQKTWLVHLSFESKALMMCKKPICGFDHVSWHSQKIAASKAAEHVCDQPQ